MSKFRTQHMTIDWHDIIDCESTVSAADAPLKEKTYLVGRVGLLMLSVGTAAWRVRASMNKIARALNITCNADIGLLSIEYTCVENGETCTNALSLKTTGVNTHKLSYLEFFNDNFAERTGKYSIEQFNMMLDKIENLPANYKALRLGTSPPFLRRIIHCETRPVTAITARVPRSPMISTGRSMSWMESSAVRKLTEAGTRSRGISSSSRPPTSSIWLSFRAPDFSRANKMISP